MSLSLVLKLEFMSASCAVSLSGALFGGFGLCGVFSCVQGLEEAEEAGGFADAAELDAEGLDLDEQVLDVDDLVSDQGLEEDADQTDQAVLEEKDLSSTAGQEPASGLKLVLLQCCVLPACTCL